MNDKEQNQTSPQKKLTLKSVLERRITNKTPIAPLNPIISFGDTVFCATNEISFISGKQKAGKTSVATIILSTCLTDNPNFDTLGITGKFCENRPIIYIDSEQSERSSQNILKRIAENLGLVEAPENLHVYNFHQYRPKELREAFEVLLHHHKDAFLWFLDGISDMIDSVNNEVDANELMHFLNVEKAKNSAGMILFLHENPTSTNDKMRGHLGSIGGRKCFSAISVSKDKCKQTHAIKSVEQREGKNFRDVIFRFNKETSKMESIEGIEYEKIKSELGTDGNDFMNSKYRDLIGIDERVARQDFIKRIMNLDKCSESTAIKKITKLVDLEMINFEKKSNKQVEYFINAFYTNIT